MNPLVRWLKSMRYAYEGLQYALTTQPNMKFHFFASFAVLVSALFFRLPRTDILLLLLAITLVIVTELINTGIEKTVDLAMPERHPLAKIAKDTAAAAVLVTAVFAVAVGIAVFYGPVERWIRHREHPEVPLSIGSVWLYLTLVVLAVIVAETRFRNSDRLRPSLWMAVSVSVSMLITLKSGDTLVGLLAFGMSGMFLVMLYEKQSRSLPGLVFGGLIGAALTVLSYYLGR
ncbi:diacylglycerol kinase family protein [Gorillibacterium sp. sgz5001074]|uniref:diacylglycerol kinase family protein n=1 Tax=Gorillibacterium sp. sgz5001074 TaxID=3446695 RepID=UPI003F671B54